MRGCLFSLALGAILIAVLVVVGLPAAAEGILTGGLRAAGLESDDLAVTVKSDPPTDLIGMHADHVRVLASDAAFRGMDIGKLDLALDDVAILSRTAGTIEGTLSDVTVKLATGDEITLAQIGISGDTERITATTGIPRAQAESLITEAVERQTGVRPADVTLTSPDKVSILTPVGLAIDGTLAVTAGGDLVLRGEGPLAGRDAILLRGGQDLPLELTDVRISSQGAIRLTGDLAISILG